MLTCSVLIAEDEPLVARFIGQVIEKIEGLQVLEICSSAEEACNYISSHQPKILVTDIRMRDMSGLELVRYAKRVKPDIKVIIISGYGLFEYAKEAMKLGIEDYLLKPIDPDELTASLKNIQNTLLRVFNEKTNQSLKRLLTAGSFEKIGALYDCKQVNLLMACQSGDPENALELCAAGISYLDDVQVNAALWNNAVVVIEPRREESRPSCLPKLEEWMVANRDTKTFAVLSVKDSVDTDSLESTLPEVYRALRRSRILGVTICRSYPLDQPVSTEYANEVPVELLSRNVEKVKAAFTSLFTEWEQERRTIWQVRSALFIVIDKLRQVYPISEQLPIYNEKIAEILRFADTFSEARETIWKLLEQIVHEEPEDRGEARINLKTLYQEVASYVQRNCDKNDSLQEIAKRFHVSQPYISRAFRVYAGMSYKEYCMRQKIELAKAIIRTQQDVLFKDVATKVGIEQTYFSTVFHRMTGLYPSEYKAMQEEKN